MLSFSTIRNAVFEESTVAVVNHGRDGGQKESVRAPW
jgi:hypothetical protein